MICASIAMPAVSVRRMRVPSETDCAPFPVSVSISAFDTVLVAFENEHAVSLKAELREGCGTRIAIVIGPEGGFSDAEIETLTGKGARSVSLGTRILRTETAGMAMLAQIMYEVEP